MTQNRMDCQLPNILNVDQLFQNDDSNVSLIASHLQQHGWTTIEVDKKYFTIDEMDSLRNWEQVFTLAFGLNLDRKVSSGVYRTENHVSVGYRQDNEREFFETRLCSNGLSEPNFDQYVQRYSQIVVNMYSALNKISSQCLKRIAMHLGLDERVFVDLTDIAFNGILPPLPEKKSTVILSSSNHGNATSSTSPTNNPSMEQSLPSTPKVLSQRYSSSLLRICKYLNDNIIEGDINNNSGGGEETHNAVNDNPPISTPPVTTATPNSTTRPTHSKTHVTFGAHTDSSFLTVALCSTVPGLQVVDQKSNQWVCPEIAPSISFNGDKVVRVVVFVGEFLQVLTKNRFRACVHRVVSRPSERSPHTTNDEPTPRISCPYLVRGLNNAVIDMHNTDRYTHPGGAAALDSSLMPDLDGTNMRLLHTMLDLKRQKCFRDNDSRPGNWVLSAYPVENMPPEEEEEEQQDEE